MAKHLPHSKLLVKGKAPQKAMMAVGRELLGFIWAVGVEAERTAGSAERIRRSGRARD